MRSCFTWSECEDTWFVKLDEPFGSILYLVLIYFICTIGDVISSNTHDQREVLRRSIGVRLVCTRLTITHECEGARLENIIRRIHSYIYARMN